jgi:ribonucleoside-diphosphate reductase beta chain
VSDTSGRTTAMLHDDVLAGRLPDYRELYYLWEREQWEGGKIALAVDRQQWGGLDAFVRTAVRRELEWRRGCAGAATNELGAYVDAAPSEEQQVALTTQLADLARQLAFLDRFWVEVTGGESWSDGGVSEADELMDLVALPTGGLVPGLARFHLVVVGALGSTAQRALNDFLEAEDLLPGLRTGLGLMARDCRRHVAFALRFLSEAAERDEQTHTTVERALSEAWPVAAETLRSLGDPTLASGADQRVGTARASFETWLTTAGLRVSLPR